MACNEKTSAIARWAALAACTAAACGGPSGAGQQDALGMSVLASEVRGREIVERYDLSGDGQPDVWKSFVVPDDMAPEEAGEADRVLVRKEMDINFDSRVDIRKHYNADGALAKEEMDLDFDGRFDAINHYKSGQINQREMDMAFDGRTDVWKYYEEGRLVRKARDSNGDGRPDFWEYYQDGRLVRTGSDLDGDGNPETFQDIPRGT